MHELVIGVYEQPSLEAYSMKVDKQSALVALALPKSYANAHGVMFRKKGRNSMSEWLFVEKDGTLAPAGASLFLDVFLLRTKLCSW